MLESADAVLVLDTDVPWLPFFKEPKPGCKIIQIGPDPLFAHIPVRSFTAIEPITSTVGNALGAAHRARWPRRPPSKTAPSSAGASASPRRTARSWRGWQGMKSNGRTITKPYLSKCVSDAKADDDIVVNEYPLLRRVHAVQRSPAPSSAAGPAGGLGWGLAGRARHPAAPSRTAR